MPEWYFSFFLFMMPRFENQTKVGTLDIVNNVLLLFYIFEDVKSVAIIVNTDIPCIKELYGIMVCNAISFASFFWGEHSGREFYLPCLGIVDKKARRSLITIPKLTQISSLVSGLIFTTTKVV